MSNNKNTNRKRGLTQESINKINFHRDKLYKESYNYFIEQSLESLQARAKKIIAKEENLSVIRQIALRNAILRKNYELVYMNSLKNQDINQTTEVNTNEGK